MIYIILSNLNYSKKVILELFKEYYGLIVFISNDIVLYITYFCFILYTRCYLNFYKIEYNIKVILSIWIVACINGIWGIVYIYCNPKTLSVPILIIMCLIRVTLVITHVTFYSIIRCKSKREAFWFLIS